LPEGADAVSNVLALIEEALAILHQHPLIGRPVDLPLRELIISQGKTGFVALYSYEEAFYTALVLAIRHQREAGFRIE
jgi:plasmid stabilization system protein ParE